MVNFKSILGTHSMENGTDLLIKSKKEYIFFFFKFHRPIYNVNGLNPSLVSEFDFLRSDGFQSKHSPFKYAIFFM